MKPLLAIEGLHISFPSPAGPVSVVKDLKLSLPKGELLALVGESGSGKSLTALSLLQLLPATAQTSGKALFYEGEKPVDLLSLGTKDSAALRGNRIAFIFQEPMTALNPVLTCGRQIMEVLRHHRRLSKAEARAEAIRWLGKVRLPEPESLLRRYPHQLSGGQKQRVMIAMALCCRPALLICDEPTTALDVTVQKAVLELIRELQQEMEMSVLFITHDLGVVSDIADQVAVMYQGHLLESGTRDAVLERPQHRYTQALLACRPAQHARGRRLPVVADLLNGNTTDIGSTPPALPSETVLAEVRNLTVRFPLRHNLFGRTTAAFTAVDGINLRLYEGESLGLVGESGCGKTTLGRTLLRLAEPTEGQILIKGKDLARLSPAELRQYRRTVQLVFQDPYSALNPRLTIGEALEEPLLVLNRLSGKERRVRVRRLLDQVGLPETASGRYPHAFSGGQRQRIVIARALAPDPMLLVCDESVSALDVSVQAQVLNLLNDLRSELGLTLLFISHDLSVVRYMSDRIAVMQAGRIVELGAADNVYTQPAHPYTQALLAALPGRK